jgi:cell division protein FtsW (lipid II flippase)
MKDKLLAFVAILSIGGLASTAGIVVYWYTNEIIGDSWASLPMYLTSPIVVILFSYACFVYTHTDPRRATRKLAFMIAIYASGFTIPLVLISYGASEFGFQRWVFPVLLGLSLVEIAVVLWTILVATKKAKSERAKAQLRNQTNNAGG